MAARSLNIALAGVAHRCSVVHCVYFSHGRRLAASGKRRSMISLGICQHGRQIQPWQANVAGGVRRAGQ